MTRKQAFHLLITFLFATVARSQNAKTDSAGAATALKSLWSICRNVDFGDPTTAKLRTFFKAAAFILYRGDDKKRAWKDFANYSSPGEKKGVDAVCTHINETVNRDSAYKIVKYLTQKESEGLWLVLIVSYNREGTEKKAAFAFLKINQRFGLGDIV